MRGGHRPEAWAADRSRLPSAPWPARSSSRHSRARTRVTCPRNPREPRGRGCRGRHLLQGGRTEGTDRSPPASRADPKTSYGKTGQDFQRIQRVFQPGNHRTEVHVARGDSPQKSEHREGKKGRHGQGSCLGSRLHPGSQWRVTWRRPQDPGVSPGDSWADGRLCPPRFRSDSEATELLRAWPRMQRSDVCEDTAPQAAWLHGPLGPQGSIAPPDAAPPGHLGPLISPKGSGPGWSQLGRRPSGVAPPGRLTPHKLGAPQGMVEGSDRCPSGCGQWPGTSPDLSTNRPDVISTWWWCWVRLSLCRLFTQVDWRWEAVSPCRCLGGC